MAYCGIMRVEKRGRAAITGLEAEANRTEEDHSIKGRDFPRSDIDWDLTNDNIFLVKTEGWQQAITKQIKEAEVRERKNSTIMIDAFYGASGEWFENHSKEQWLEYFNQCLEFHIKEYCLGNRKRLLNAVIHLDEKTPHMQVASVPIFEDEKGFHLSARDILGGRGNFRKRQDKFYDEVSKKWGLERGEIRDWQDIKKHTTKREWQIATQQEEIRQLEEAKNFIISNQETEIRQAEEEKRQALRERDKAKADFEVEKEINNLKEFLQGEYLNLDNLILEEKEAGKKFGKFGEELPARVVITRENFEQIEYILDSQSRLDKMFERFDLSLQEMKEKALEIHQNNLDAHEVATNERVIKAEQELGIEKNRRRNAEEELKKANKTIEENNTSINSLTEQLRTERSNSKDLREKDNKFQTISNHFNWSLDELTLIVEMETTFQNRQNERYFNLNGEFLSKVNFLKRYIDKCKNLGITPLKKAGEELELELSKDRQLTL